MLASSLLRRRGRGNRSQTSRLPVSTAPSPQERVLSTCVKHWTGTKRRKQNEIMSKTKRNERARNAKKEPKPNQTKRHKTTPQKSKPKLDETNEVRRQKRNEGERSAAKRNIKHEMVRTEAKTIPHPPNASRRHPSASHGMEDKIK